MGCPLYPVQTSLFPPTAGDVFLKTGFFNLYLHLTNAVKRQISSRYYHFNVITILSNSSAIKRVVIASMCAEAQSKAKGKQSNTNSHSEPCPEQGRRNSEESQSYCEGEYAMPRPEQIEKYTPQFVISSIRERSDTKCHSEYFAAQYRLREKSRSLAYARDDKWWCVFFDLFRSWHCIGSFAI